MNSKSDFGDKFKRVQKKTSYPASRAYGCRRLFLAGCLTLASICAVPVVLTSPELHWHIDNYIQPPVITPAAASSESDMIAFICRKYDEYPRNRLFILNPDTGGLRQVFKNHSRRYRDISWSPDGAWLLMSAENMAFYGYFWRYSNSEIYRVRFDELESRRLTYNQNDYYFPHWSDDGSSISFYSHKSIHQISVNGNEVSQTDNAHISALFSPTLFAWSSDNQMFAYSPHSFVAFGTNPDGRDWKELEKMEHSVDGIEWSPTNEEILYYSSDKLVVFNVKTNAERTSVNMGVIFGARWSPDGNWIAIMGRAENVDSGIYLYLLDVQTSDIQSLTNGDIGTSGSISWSPDSEWIAFSDFEWSFRYEDRIIGRLYSIKREGTGLQQLADMDCRIDEISWSPR